MLSAIATRMRELVLEKLSAIGLDPKRFGLHSLRSGGEAAALMQECLIAEWSKGMEGGAVRMPKTVT